jgi:hypothetical protein
VKGLRRAWSQDWVNRLTPDFLAILQTLVVHRVDFLVVGGICAVPHGAPIAI